MELLDLGLWILGVAVILWLLTVWSWQRSVRMRTGDVSGVFVGRDVHGNVEQHRSRPAPTSQPPSTSKTKVDGLALLLSIVASLATIVGVVLTWLMPAG